MAERWVTYFLPHFLKLFNLNKYYEPSCSPVGRSVCHNFLKRQENTHPIGGLVLIWRDCPEDEVVDECCLRLLLAAIILDTVNLKPEAKEQKFSQLDKLYTLEGEKN